MIRKVKIEGIMLIEDGYDECGNKTWEENDEDKTLPTLKELLENKETIQDIIEEQIAYDFEFSKCELLN